MTCKICEHSGLAFLFTYHGAIASDAKLAPIGANLLATHQESIAALGLPEVKHARYVLRLLRPGYLHIYHETEPAWLAQKKKAQKKIDPEAGHWESFRITDEHALIPEDHPDFGTKAPFQCSRDGGSHLLTAVTYRLPDAHGSGNIWVAFSANRWTSKLRKKNKANTEVMQAIDIAALLGGNLEANMVKPEAAWLDKYLTEFALTYFRQGSKESAFPFANTLYHQGKQFQKHLGDLDGNHPKTKDRSVVFVLRDPVGTSASLGNVSAARHRQAVDYAQSQRHPLGAAQAIDFIRDGVYQAKEAELKSRPLKKSDAYNAIGKPLFSDRDMRAFPDGAELSKWMYMGTMSYQSFVDGKNIHKNLPASARWLGLVGQMGYGSVIAPIQDVATVQTRILTRKMDRLHDGKAKETFQQDFQAALDKFEQQLCQHSADHAAFIGHPALKAYFLEHFDPEDPNSPRQECKPGITYMEEANQALIGWGGITPESEAAIKALMDAKIESLDGWALRALVANQKGLFSTLDDFWSQQYDWFTNPANKLDKSYDALKALLGDEEVAKKLYVPRFGWLNSAGIGLSFGMMGFLGGAATHIAANALTREFPSTVSAGGKAIGKARGLADLMANGIVAKELKLAAKINTWCNHQAALLEGALHKKPPARPLYVRTTVTMAQALEILVDMKAQKVSFNRKTRELFQILESMPEAMRSQTISLDFLTTDVALDDAKNIKGVADSAEQVRVSVLSHTKAAGVGVASLSVAQLGEIYRKAHRFDALKKGLVDIVRDGVPQLSKFVASAGGAVASLPGAAARGMTERAGHFAFFGAFLQYRLMLGNEESIQKLEAKLAGSLTPVQREAIQDALAITKLGLWDNYAGVTGGVTELMGIGAHGMQLTGTASALLTVAAFAGAAASFFNAMQNFTKAMGKRKEGDDSLKNAYYGVGFLYGLASASFAASGFEIAVHWFVERKVLPVGLTSTATRFGYGIALRGLSLTGWGLVFTVGAFAVEGIVAYYDRTKLETWVEVCYFGDKPKYRGPDGKANDPSNWDSEAKFLGLSLEEASGQGAVEADVPEKAEAA